MRVLIVDDIKDNLELLKLLLVKNGYTVQLAYNGQEAFEKLNNEAFDLIISDILMPIMDGFILCHHCKTDEQLRQIPFIFYTATYNSKKDEEFALSLGAEKFIRKPTDPVDFLNIIKNVLVENSYSAKKQNEIAILEDETEVLKLYSERLILKLEKKMLDLEKEIAERIKTEEKLRVSESKNKSLINALPDILFVLDSENKFIDYHTAKNQNLLVSPQDFIGKSMEELMPHDVVGKFAKAKLQTKKEGKSQFFEYKLDYTNDVIKYFEANLVSYQNDNTLVVVRDISERIKAEEQIRLLGKAVQQSPTSIEITDKEGNIIYVNPKFEEVTGYRLDELIGGNPRILKSGEQSNEFYYELWNTIMSGKEWHGEFHNKKKSGELYWESAVISPVFDSNGDIMSYVAVKEDISAKKKMINDLILAKQKAEESDKLKTAFLHNISHEIRTPLNAISGFSGLLRNPNIAQEKLNRYTSIIQNSSEQLISVVTDILTISSLEANQEKVNIEKVNINSLLDELFSIFKQQSQDKNIKIRKNLNLNSSQSDVKTDKTKLTQIISNLLSNALKFTDEGFIELGCNLKDKELEFYVKDSGIGIDSKSQNLIFERFKQADKSINKLFGGTGLGLSISKGFVELMGGEIWIDSQVGKGATFYFTIPYESENKASNLSEKIIKNILVAEDDELNYIYIEELLEDLRLNLIHVENGQQAVDYCKTNPDIDLVLMDIKMPVMTGDVATKLIKEFRPDLKIIAQTAYALEQERRDIEQLFDAYVVKPINKDKMIALILSFLY